MDVEPGQYWEFTGDDDPDDERKRDDLEKGDLVLVIKIEDHVWVPSGGGGRSGYDPTYFVNHFRLVPDGEARRREEIGKLIHEIAQPAPAELGEKLITFSPHVATDGNLLLEAGKEATAPSTSKALSAKTRPTTMVQAKAKVNEFRVALKKFQVTVQERQQHLARLLDEQKQLLNSKLAGMQEMIARAEEAVWTLNLYLGKDEKVVRLKKGTSALPEQRIVIRQLVLYMDEECAIGSEQGGMDFKDISTFDKWLLDPKHLQQVIPETKAVIALKPRRNAKDYGSKDPWLEAKLNENNRVTYWLIRNGDNLYRIYTCLPVGDVTVPRREEFDDLLTKDEYDWSTHTHEKVVLRPGSDGWMKAMDKVDARRRHYMRVLLFLQGLIDRTHIFHPMPVERINLMQERTHAEFVDYVYDGQEDRLLPTGRVKFHEWQKALNEKLDVGHRIIGFFDWRSREEIKERVRPKQASSPGSLMLYALEQKKGDRLFFRYKRAGDVVWGRSWREKEHEPRRRASYWVEPCDRNVLNFDLADVGSMSFYLSDRVNRHAYVDMFPVLKTCIALKEKEQQKEAPFRLLLVGEIMKAYEATHGEAEAAVPDLVHWWKLKNKIHRALLSNDAKALRMIVAEFGLRRGLGSSTADHATVVALLREYHPDVLLIAYKGKESYVVLVPENKENVYVRELLYVYRQRDDTLLGVLAEHRWRLVDTRLWSWTILHESERMKTWPRDLRRDHFLTDPEKATIARWAIERAEEAAKSSHRDVLKKGVETVAVSLERDIVKVFMANWDCTTPKRLLTERGTEPFVGWFEYKWTRKRDTVSLGKPQNWYSGDWHQSGDVLTSFTNTIWEDKAAIENLEVAAKHVKNLREQHRVLKHIANAILWKVRAAVRERVIAKARAEYLAEYGDDSLFETETAKVEWDYKVPNGGVYQAAQLVVEQNISVDGMTLGELYAKAREYGFKRDKEKDGDMSLFPMDFVIKLEKEDAE